MGVAIGTAVRKYRLCMICADKFMDDFMHASDVFEAFKRLGYPRFMTVTLEPDATIEEVIDRMVSHAQKSMAVSALFVVGTSVGWVNPDVKVVSDGESFGMIEQVLADNGYAVSR